MTILITGANGNLGTEVTNHFLNAGHRIIATVHNKEGLQDLPQHPQLEAVVVNLANEEESKKFITTILDKYRKIDAALLLAGGFAAGKIESTTSTQIKQQLSLNFDTAFHVAQPVFMHMIKNNYGKLVFVGARPALKPAQGKNMIAYSLSKSLLFRMAEFLNEEAKGKNVTATVIVPSTIDTPANRQSMPDADPAKWVSTRSIAEVLEFILSDKASPLRETVLKLYNQS